MDSSGWQPDRPKTLANGMLVCGKHYQVVCGICICDYSFMQEILDDEEEANEGPEDDDLEDDSEEDDFRGDCEMEMPTPMNKDGFVSFRDMFAVRPGSTPPRSPGYLRAADHYLPAQGETPHSSFEPKITNFMGSRYRIVSRTNPREFLIYTDGSCLDNGRPSPRAGCAFIFHPGITDQPRAGSCSFKLENRGPSGELHPQTSNRAELRAVIAALQFRFWKGEGFESMVIATDSEYVVKGATTWVNSWQRNEWRTRSGQDVKNKDLWEMLLDDIDTWRRRGLKVRFWHIPRNLNHEADAKAREAATESENENFGKIVGVMG